MSDRRPSSPARRPAQGSRPSGSRPAGSRPNPSSASRRPAPRRKRHASGRFYLFLAILVVVIVAVVLLLWKPWATSPDPVQSNSDAANPAATSSAGSSSLGLDLSDDQETDSVAASLDGSGDDVSALSMHLGNEDEQLQGLSDEQLFQVEDLHINPDLPSEWKNVLLLGTDQRSLDESSRSDTMIICSINTTTGEVKLCSIMRDMAAEIPDRGLYKINSANCWGAPWLAVKLVNECFGMNIEDYAMVNFFGFQQVADYLGGIEMDITKEEMEQIDHNVGEQIRLAREAGIDESNLPQEHLTTYGENTHLDGRQTLGYARIRKLAGEDFGRAERQRKVLMALLEKMMGTPPLEITRMAANLFDYFNTSLTAQEAITIASQVLSSGLTEVETLYLPQNGT